MAIVPFVREFLRNPTQLGAVAPSGEELARRMVDAAGIAPHHTVVELGAGTGPITTEIVRRHPGLPLIALEPNAALAAALRQRLPTVQVLERTAEELPTLLADRRPRHVDRVISSLPWAIWPDTVQRACFEAILGSMAQDGRLVTFAYVHAQVLPAAKRLRRTLAERFRSVETTPVAWRNVPPAFVFVCDR